MNDFESGDMGMHPVNARELGPKGVEELSFERSGERRRGALMALGRCEIG